MKENSQRCLPELALALMLCMGSACANEALDAESPDEPLPTRELSKAADRLAPGAREPVDGDGSSVAESHGERETIIPNRGGPAAIDSDESAARTGNVQVAPPKSTAVRNNR